MKSPWSGYAYPTILLNGRQVSLTNLAAEQPHSPFEAETLSFLKAWLSGEQVFQQATSGSTGKPKTITLSRHLLHQSAQRTLAALPVKSGQTALVCLDTRYIAGKMMLVRALTANLKIVAIEPAANPIAGLPAPIDFMAVVPLQMHHMIQESITLLRQIQTILIGGAPVPPQLYPAISNLPGAVYATYGMTETASNIALQRLSGPTPDHAFRPLPGVSLQVNDQGCLVIQLPELHQPIITRDVAELLPNGTFRIRGRLDNAVNSGGIKIFPEETEAAIAPLLAGEGVTSAFFTGALPHPILGEQLVLVVEGNPLPPQVEAHILTSSRQLLGYRAPRSIHYLRDFKRTPTGKIMRKETMAMLQHG